MKKKRKRSEIIDEVWFMYGKGEPIWKIAQTLDITEYQVVTILGIKY